MDWTPHQGGKNIWPLWEFGRCAEERHAALPRLPRDGRAICRNRYPFAALYALLERDCRIRPDVCDLDRELLDVRPHRLDQPVVECRVPRVQQHVDATLVAVREARPAQLSIAHM